MISRIHFIRHGITEGIKNRWFYGWEDLPLIEEGVRETAGLRSLAFIRSLGMPTAILRVWSEPTRLWLPYMAMFLLRSSPILRK